MKKIENMIKETYQDGEFIIEISDTGGTWEAYIFHQNCGIKMIMFGLPKHQQSYEDALNVIAANVPEYKRKYRKEYMCPTNWFDLWAGPTSENTGKIQVGEQNMTFLTEDTLRQMQDLAQRANTVSALASDLHIEADTNEDLARQISNEGLLQSWLTSLEEMEERLRAWLGENDD